MSKIVRNYFWRAYECVSFYATYFGSRLRGRSSIPSRGAFGVEHRPAVFYLKVSSGRSDGSGAGRVTDLWGAVSSGGNRRASIESDPDHMAVRGGRPHNTAGRRRPLLLRAAELLRQLGDRRRLGRSITAPARRRRCNRHCYCTGAAAAAADADASVSSLFFASVFVSASAGASASVSVSVFVFALLFILLLLAVCC